METQLDNTNVPKRKGNLVLRNLSKIQMDKILNKGLGISAIGIGAGALAIIGFAKRNVDGEFQPVHSNFSQNDNDAETSESNIVICTEAPFAVKVTDEMDFQTAFQTARDEVGPGGFFEYKGCPYSTYTSDEWSAMTEEQHQVYWSSIDDKIDEIIPVDSNTEISMHDTQDHSDIQLVEVDNEASSAIVIEDEDAHFEQLIQKEMDSNHDGFVDIVAGDFDQNGITDLVLDTNFDQNPDIILQNVTIDGNHMHFENAFDTSWNVIDFESNEIELPDDNGNEIEMNQIIDHSVDNESYYPDHLNDLDNAASALDNEYDLDL